MFRAYDTRIIWHIESIISQEQVIVAVTVDDFGCLGSLLVSSLVQKKGQIMLCPSTYFLVLMTKTHAAPIRKLTPATIIIVD